MKRAARIDQSHPEVRSTFRLLGWSWCDLYAAGNGVADGVAAPAHDPSAIWFVEVKTPKAATNKGTREKQAEFAAKFRTVQLRSRDEVIAFVNRENR